MALTKNVIKYLVTVTTADGKEGKRRVFNEKDEADNYVTQLKINGISANNIGFFILRSKEPV